MRNVLADIVAEKKKLVAAAKKELPLFKLRRMVKPGTFRGAARLRHDDWSLIAECKLQSPVKGSLCRRYTAEELARIYAANGAAMLSVHTDPHFLGSNEDFRRIRSAVKLPLLRKDFIIDEYQLYEARMLGADAVLLIARILSAAQLKEFVYTAWGLGMDALVEVHDTADMEAALQTPAEFIGINNRNLETFTTSIENTLALLPYADRERTIISESGVTGPEDALRLHEAGCHGILVGEGLVTSPDVAAMTRELALAGKELRQSA